MCKLIFLLSIFTYSTWSRPSADRDVAPCLKAFFIAVYNGTYNCTSGFDFTSENSTIQRKAFTSGKSCFLEVVESECSNVQYEELIFEFDYFVEVLTTKPSDEDDCENPYYQFSGQKCLAILINLSKKSAELYPIEMKINDSRVLTLIDQCEEVQRCIKSPCLSTPEVQSVVSGACERVNMKNSEFITCQFQLDRTPKDKLNFTCLDDFDFFGNTLETEKLKFSTKKECTKEVMEKICGKSAVEKFDFYADIMMKSIESIETDD